jgi:hypothetical protein
LHACVTGDYVSTDVGQFDGRIFSGQIILLSPPSQVLILFETHLAIPFGKSCNKVAAQWVQYGGEGLWEKSCKIKCQPWQGALW